jgi:hypothetical protein
VQFPALLFLILALVAVVAPGYAQAQPTDDDDYDTAHIELMVDTVVGDIPIRTGFWNDQVTNRYTGKPGEGFGRDKAWHKHGVTSLAVIEYVMQGTNVKPVGGDEETDDMYEEQDEGLNFFREVQTLTCPNVPDLGEVCVTKDGPLDMVVAVNQEDKSEYYGKPAGNPVGLQTAFCDRNTYDYDPNFPDRCPAWINTAMSQGLIA